jgi:cell wall-associated NlpC family hydrolase
LTQGAWAAAGVSLPHSSRAQYSSGRKVSKSDLQPGDLVFFYSPISHVGIYIGDGNMIHASNPSKPVAIAPIDYIPFSGAVRP